MIYKVFIERRVQKYLASLPQADYHRIKKTILSLAHNPRPPGCKKLKGRNGYRIRQGNYRIIYEIM